MRKLFLSVVALLSIGGAYSFANYTMTQGAGTTFGSVIVGGFHYVQMFICDVTTPGQCAAVSAAGAVKVDGSAVTQPVSGTVTATVAGVSTAALQGTGNTSLSSIDGKTPALGQALAAASVPVILPAATITTLTPPTSVTANAGTNLNTSALATSANQTNGTQQAKITDGTNVAGVAPASTLPAATVPAMVVISRADDPLLTTASTCKAGTAPTTQTAVATGAVTSIQCDLNGNVYTRAASEYPTGAIPYTASATGTTAATAATLTGAASVTTYICGFSIRANATAASTANSTVAGTITGTMNYTQWTAPAASGLGITEQIFTPCIPASGTNTSIVVTSAAPGTGGVVSVSAWGYKQ